MTTGLTSLFLDKSTVKVMILTKVASVSIDSLPYNNLLCDVVIINSPIISTNPQTKT